MCAELDSHNNVCGALLSTPSCGSTLRQVQNTSLGWTPLHLTLPYYYLMFKCDDALFCFSDVVPTGRLFWCYCHTRDGWRCSNSLLPRAAWDLLVRQSGFHLLNIQRPIWLIFQVKNVVLWDVRESGCKQVVLQHDRRKTPQRLMSWIAKNRVHNPLFDTFFVFVDCLIDK